MDQIRLALLVPLLVISATVFIVGGIGILLLLLSGVVEVQFGDQVLAIPKEDLLGIKEPYAVLGALLLAVGILIGAAILAKGKPGDSE